MSKRGAPESAGRPWSGLSGAEAEFELAKRGTTPEYLIRDAEDVPKLRERMSLLSSPEAKLRLALEWFGDQGHPQPEKRTRPITGQIGDLILYDDLTPVWGWLPSLDRDDDKGDHSDQSKGEQDDEHDEKLLKILLGGLPYPKVEYETAGKLYRAEKLGNSRMTVAGIKKRCGLSTSRAFRVYLQYRAGAVVYDDAGLHTGPDYRWDPARLDHDPQRFKLIRR